MTLTTVGYHIQPKTFMGKLSCGLCALCGVFIITLPIPIVVSSFAVCYRNKLWRNEIAVRRRIATIKRKNTKEEIIFHLATSSGMSGREFFFNIFNIKVLDVRRCSQRSGNLEEHGKYLECV